MNVQWIEVPGQSFPVRLTTLEDGTVVASLLDWRLAGRGSTPCDALQALSEAVTERWERALDAERRRASA